MGEYEPHDSRNVTLKQDRAPGEPRRTGPQEGETRRQMRQEQAGETELEQDERGDDAEQVVDPQAQQAMREASMEQDADELELDSVQPGRDLCRVALGDDEFQSRRLEAAQRLGERISVLARRLEVHHSGELAGKPRQAARRPVHAEALRPIRQQAHDAGPVGPHHRDDQ